MALSGKEIRSIIRTFRQTSEKEGRQFDKWLRWYRTEFYAREDDLPSGSGEPEDDLGPGETFESNYLYAYTDTMVSNIVPQNPEVTVNARMTDDTAIKAARVRQALVNDALRRDKAFRKLQQAAVRTSICGICVIKGTWNFPKKRPQFRVLDPRYVYFDRDAEEWEDIRFIVEATVLTRGEYEARVKRKTPGRPKKGEDKDLQQYDPEVADQAKFGGYPSWLKNPAMRNPGQQQTTGDHEVFQWVVVYEVYDFTEPEVKFYHFLDESDEALFAGARPYQFVKNTFHLMAFTDNLKDLTGLSDAQLIAPTLTVLNEMDSVELAHAQTSVPIPMIDQSRLEDPEAFFSALRRASQPGDTVPLQLRPDALLRDVLATTPTPSLTPSFDTMRARAEHKIEYQLGISQYERGAVGNVEVATEVALADTANRTRNGRRQKVIFDTIGWMAGVIVALYQEFLEEGSTVWVRAAGSRDALAASWETLGFQAEALRQAKNEEPFEYDYDAIPYSPAENDRLLQLRNIRENWDTLQVLAQSGIVSPERLGNKVLALLQLEDIATDATERAQAAQQAASMAQAQAGPTPGAGGGDTMATGALPPGVPEPVDMNPGAGAGVNNADGNLGTLAGLYDPSMPS